MGSVGTLQFSFTKLYLTPQKHVKLFVFLKQVVQFMTCSWVVVRLDNLGHFKQRLQFVPQYV